MVVVCDGERSVPAVFRAGAGVEAVRVQPATVVNNQLPVIWASCRTWTGEDTVVVTV